MQVSTADYYCTVPAIGKKKHWRQRKKGIFSLKNKMETHNINLLLLLLLYTTWHCPIGAVLYLVSYLWVAIFQGPKYNTATCVVNVCHQKYNYTHAKGYMSGFMTDSGTVWRTKIYFVAQFVNVVVRLEK